MANTLRRLLLLDASLDSYELVSFHPSLLSGWSVLRIVLPEILAFTKQYSIRFADSRKNSARTPVVAENGDASSTKDGRLPSSIFYFPAHVVISVTQSSFTSGVQRDY